MPPYLLFLLQRDDAALREMALISLQAMRAGGIWDQLDGGIHRYSTDQHWLVPHFEKMLYDQALVAYSSLEAYALTRQPDYLEMAEDLLGFVLRDLRAPEGGFYCGLDADSEGREGACYIWHLTEIEQLLGADAPLFSARYGVTEAGNFENPGENVLHQALSLTELAARHGLHKDDLVKRLEHCCHSLSEQRSRREQPLRDLKILTGWNGLMIAALARGSALTGSLPWLEAARQAANFISKHLITAEGRLLRSYLIAPASITAFLEDYAFLAWGYLELYQASQNPGDLDQAGSLCSTALELFSSADGRLRTAGSDAEQLPLALPDMHDGVIPGGASVMATNLTRLAEITGSETWKKAAGTLLKSYHANLQQAPVNSLWMLQALAETDQGPGKKPGP